MNRGTPVPRHPLAQIRLRDSEKREDGYCYRKIFVGIRGKPIYSMRQRTRLRYKGNITSDTDSPTLRRTDLAAGQGIDRSVGLSRRPTQPQPLKQANAEWLA